MNDLEKRYLDGWAWSIASCDPKHTEKCEAMGGARSKCDDSTNALGCGAEFRDLRYPGYIGSRYEPGGILCVGMVHNGNELFFDAFKDVEKATKEWVDSSREDDAKYLSCVQQGYESSICSWGPWKQLGRAVKEILGIGEDGVAASIAYTNIAKCWTVPRTGNDQKIMRFCASTFPIKNLVSLINPSLIIAWGISIPKNVDWGMDSAHETVYKIYAGLGTHRPGDRDNGEAFATWVAAAKKIYGDAHSRKNGGAS